MLIRERRNVYMAQVNYRYGDNVFMPYSVATLQAYAQTDSEIRANFQFQKPIFLREDPDQIARTMEKPAVLGLSNYIWNWEYNKLLAQAVKAYHPNCLIVMGGIHIPEKSQNFFIDHSYADVVVHGEGEVSFAKILLAVNASSIPDLSGITGLSVRNGTLAVSTGPAQRITEAILATIPSPYLAGVFDWIPQFHFLWQASQETNRGCPYPCTFCAWGPAYQQKLYKFPEARILPEIEWFGQNQIEYIFSCDANWGILDRDYDLTLKMVEAKNRHGGYPKKFRMCTAKNSNDRIFDITKVLDDAGMNKGATLSFQSMDDNVLEIVKRKNIKIKDFADFMRRYREAKIATYTELIMGLPGETYETFKAGIDKLIDAGQHDGLNNYVCLMLPNDEMSDPAYIDKYKIKSVRMPILLAHSSPGSDTIQEYQDVVVSTFSMTEEDWQNMFIFSWAIQSFHCLGLTQNLAIFFRRQFGLGYSDFYQEMLDFFTLGNTSLVGQQLSLTKKIILGSLTGGRLDVVMPKFGNIYWPLEEATFLNLMADKERFYQELGVFLRKLADKLGFVIKDSLLDDLISYQSAILIGPFNPRIQMELSYNLPEYFGDAAMNNPVAVIKKLPLKLEVHGERDFAGDFETYAREIVWYGRKGGKFRHSNIAVTEISIA